MDKPIVVTEANTMQAEVDQTVNLNQASKDVQQPNQHTPHNVTMLNQSVETFTHASVMITPQSDAMQSPATQVMPDINGNPSQMSSVQQMPAAQPQVQSYPPPIRPLLENDPPPTIDVVVQKNGNNQGDQQDAVTLSPQKSAITKVTLSDELNVFYWNKTKEIISQIAEKAKSSVDSVITTLDPGMKEYLYSGGNVNIIVISDSECLVGPIRDSFQSAFGRATVNSVNVSYSQPDASFDYPIKLACGFQQAEALAQEKIKKLRQDTSSIPQNQVVVVVQPALVHVDDASETNHYNDSSSSRGDQLHSNWFTTYCILIEDPILSVTMKCFSQLIPVDSDVIEQAKQVQRPENFQNNHLGFATSLSELMSSWLKFDPSCGLGDEYGCYWLREWAGIYESHMIQQVSLTLAYSYRRKWDDCARIDTKS